MIFSLTWPLPKRPRPRPRMANNWISRFEVQSHNGCRWGTHLHTRSQTNRIEWLSESVNNAANYCRANILPSRVFAQRVLVLVPETGTRVE